MVPSTFLVSYEDFLCQPFTQRKDLIQKNGGMYDD